MDLTSRLERLSPRKFFLLIASILIVSRLPTLFIQVFDLDETVHATAGWAWAHGGIPYIDFVDHKPPLQWFFYRLAFEVFPFDLRFVHALTILVVGITIWAVYLALRPISRDGARWAAVLYVVLSVSYKWHDMLSTDNEVIFNLPVALALAAYINGFRRRGWSSDLAMLLAGVLVGVGFWVKPQAGITLAAFGLHLFWAGLPRTKSGLSWPLVLRRLSWITAGFVAMGLAMAAWANSLGILKQMLYWTFSYNFGYIASGPSGGRYLYKFLKIPLWMAGGSLLAWIGYVGAIRAYRQNRVSHEVWVFLFLVLLTFIPVQMGRFYPHYFIQFYPGLFAAGGIGLAYWISRFRARPASARSVQPVIAVLLIVPLALSVVLGVVRKIQKANEEDAAYWRQIGSYVRRHTPEDGRIFVWGFAAPIYYWAKRLPATKFLLTDTSVSGYIPGSGPLLEKGMMPRIEEVVRKADRDTLLAQLEARRPEIIVDTSPAAIHHFEHYPLSTFPRLERWITAHYRVGTRVAGAAIWRRIDRAEAADAARPEVGGGSVISASQDRVRTGRNALYGRLHSPGG